jgi:prevent-host-death family protein
MRASAKEMRTKSHEILEAVSRGEEVVITYRGKARARIIGYEKDRGFKDGEHPLFGMWKDKFQVEDVGSYVRRLRKGRFEC